MKFWTSVSTFRDDILLRGYEDGRRVRRAVPYEPTLYELVREPSHPDEFGYTKAGYEERRSTGFRSLHGEPVRPVQFPTIRTAKEHLKAGEGKTVYGYDRWQYCFLAEEYPGTVEHDPELVRIAYLDIEVSTEDGFADLQVADKPVTAITFKVNDRFFAFGCHAYEPSDPRVLYAHCSDEKDLLHRFLKAWSAEDPDVISGWYIELFDIPYLVNRIRHVLGEPEAKRLSPWRFLSERTIFTRGKEHKAYVPVGVSVLDYMRVFHKLGVMTRAVETPDDYKLNTVAHNELGEKKLDYSDYDGLMDLYRRDFSRFMDYNVRDVELVSMLEDKLGLIRQIMASAYYAKVNYEDMLGTVRPVEAILHHKGLEQGIVMPPREKHTKLDLVGGFVKDPPPGEYRWIVSEDLDALYSHLTMQFNISPETKMGALPAALTVDQLLDGGLDPFQSQLRERDVVVAANMALFTRQQGFIPKILEEMYQIRVVSKQKMLEAQRAYEETKEKRWKDDAARWKSSDKVLKTFLNGFYGVVTNEYFLFYDHQNAEAITTSGQLAIRWVEKRVNAWLNQVMATEGQDYVIAMDTDSMYINFGPLVEKVCPGKTKEQVTEFLDKVCKTKLAQVIEASYVELAAYVNAPFQKMSMKRESIADRAIWTGKKNYILSIRDKEGVRFSEPKLESKGIQAIKSSTPPSCRVKIQEAIRLIMTGTEEEVVDLVTRFKAEHRSLPFDDVAFPRSANNLTRYSDPVTVYKKGSPIQVRGALLYNDMLSRHGLRSYPPIYDGDKVKYAYLLVPNLIRDNVISTPGPLPRSFQIEEVLDRDLLFEKGFVQPLKAILDAIGWRFEAKDQATLESFFG